MQALKNMTGLGKAFLAVVTLLLVYGLFRGYQYLFPKKTKAVEVTTKAQGLPPLAYDKSSNAPFRELPQLSDAAEVEAPEIRGAELAWNAMSGVNYAIGGQSTSKGSIAEELKLNIHVTVQNSTLEQCNLLYGFAEELKAGNANPTKGVHFVNWMADGAPSYFAGLNDRIKKDLGDEYVAEVVTFVGASFGEDFWAVKQKFAKDARGSLTATVPRDGDWNIIINKAQSMKWEVNHDLGTYDRNKINIVAAPNDDYVEAGKMYISGQKITLKIVDNGKYTGKDTSMAVTGVASWFPVDQQLVEGKGGLVKIASTKEYSNQMACGIIMIKKWVDDNKETVDKMIEAFGRGGDQIKSHDEALKFASQVNEVVFADKEKDSDAWYNAYKGFSKTDDDGNDVEIGGSRVFSIADAAHYCGADGSGDTYKKVYNTFGNIAKEAFPEVLTSFPDYAEVTDWSILKAVYNRTKSAGTAGSVSKTDFSGSKGAVIGDADYSIQFKLNSADLDASSYPMLDKIADQLSINANTIVEIAGHTDASGSAATNTTLSEARAKSVADYFKSKDPDLSDAGKLKAKGYGSSSPKKGLLPTDPLNRRVEIKLFKTS